MLAVGALNSRFAVPNGAAPGLSPYLVSCVVWGIGLGLGGTTGYAINPARDFGPRLAHFLLPIHGKGKSDWSYAPLPILGPAVGALLAAYLLFQAYDLPDEIPERLLPEALPAPDPHQPTSGPPR